MKISCEGKNRRMYKHNIFDRGIRYDSGYPSSREAGFSYNSRANEVTYRFYSNEVSLSGDFSFTVTHSVEEILDVVPSLYLDPYHKTAAHSLVAALKVMLAAESGISRGN